MSVHLPLWPPLSSVSIKCHQKPFPSFVLALWSSIFIFFHFPLAFLSHWDQLPCPISQKHSFYLNRFHSPTHILAAVGLSTVFASTKVLIFRNIPVLHPSPLKQTNQTALQPSQNGQGTSDSWVFLWSRTNLMFCSALVRVELLTFCSWGGGHSHSVFRCCRRGVQPEIPFLSDMYGCVNAIFDKLTLHGETKN